MIYRVQNVGACCLELIKKEDFKSRFETNVNLTFLGGGRGGEKIMTLVKSDFFFDQTL